MKKSKNPYDKRGHLYGKRGVVEIDSHMMVIFAYRDYSIEGGARERQRLIASGEIVKTKMKFSHKTVRYTSIYRESFLQGMLFDTMLNRMIKSKRHGWIARYMDYKDLCKATWGPYKVTKEKLRSIRAALRYMKEIKIVIKLDNGKKYTLRVVTSIEKPIDAEGNQYLRVHFDERFMALYSGRARL